MTGPYFDSADNASYQHPIFLEQEFFIETPLVTSLRNQIHQALILNYEGVLITGLSRDGKTKACIEICKSLRNRDGSIPPVIYGTMSNSNNNSRRMVMLTLAFGANVRKYKATAFELEHAIAEYLAEQSELARTERCVVIIDELQELNVAQVHQLSSIFNVLVQKFKLLPLFILIANSPDVDPLIQNFNENENAIVYGRFFKRVLKFRGLKSKQEVALSLRQYDRLCAIEGGPTYTQYFLGKYDLEFRLEDLAHEFWAVVEEYKHRHQFVSWGMKSFTTAVRLLLTDILYQTGLSVDFSPLVAEAIRHSNLIKEEVEL